VGLLARLGATWITRVKGPSVVPDVFMYTFRTGSRALARATIHAPQQPAPLPVLGITRTLTVRGVDLLVRDAEVGRAGPEQAYGICNGVFLNVVEVTPTVRGEAAQLAASLVEAITDSTIQ
jgi:hypothetical protein